VTRWAVQSERLNRHTKRAYVNSPEKDFFLFLVNRNDSSIEGVKSLPSLRGTLCNRWARRLTPRVKPLVIVLPEVRLVSKCVGGSCIFLTTASLLWVRFSPSTPLEYHSLIRSPPRIHECLLVSSLRSSVSDRWFLNDVRSENGWRVSLSVQMHSYIYWLPYRNVNTRTEE